MEMCMYYRMGHKRNQHVHKGNVPGPAWHSVGIPARILVECVLMRVLHRP